MRSSSMMICQYVRLRKCLFKSLFMMNQYQFVFGGIKKTCAMAFIILSLAYAILQPKLSSFSLIFEIKFIILCCDSQYVLDYFLFIQLIYLQSIQYLIILSRFGESKFQQFIPLVIPLANTPFMTQRYDFLDGVPRKHLMQLRQLKQQFLISHGQKYNGNPMSIKPVYLSQNQYRVLSSNNPAYYYQQICKYACYISTTFNNAITLIYLQESINAKIEQLLSSSLKQSQLKNIQCINFASLAKYIKSQIIKNKTIILLQPISIQQQREILQIFFPLQQQNNQLQYCRYDFNESQDIGWMYPQKLHNSQCIQILDQEAQPSLKYQPHRKILVYFDINQTDTHLSADNIDDQSLQERIAQRQMNIYDDEREFLRNSIIQKKELMGNPYQSNKEIHQKQAIKQLIENPKEIRQFRKIKANRPKLANKQKGLKHKSIFKIKLKESSYFP